MYQDNITPTIMTDLQTIIPRLWNVEWSRNDVPCNNPCSLMRKDMETLHRTKYMVGAKADGVRAFMLFSFTEDPEMDYVALVDRKGRGGVFDVRAPTEFYSGTLLDGEMVTKDGHMTYYVFDIISLSGYTMVKKPHVIRRGEMKRAVSQLVDMNKHLKHLTIVEKKWFPVGSVNFNDISRSIHPSPCDGLVFVPEHGRKLAPGRQVDHFKWKRAEDHTVDFFIQNNQLFVGDMGHKIPAQRLNINEFKNGTNLTVEDCSIIECKMTKKDGAWTAHMMRARPDKHTPNDHRVVTQTLQNVEESISLDELF